VVASGSGVQRAAGAAIAFAIVFAAPVAARAGAWTEPQGTGLLIETLFGWAGAGSPWGDNPAVKQNREDAPNLRRIRGHQRTDHLRPDGARTLRAEPSDGGHLYGL
jgi:hypothetical protein